MSKRVRDEDVVDSAIVDSKRKSEKKKKKKRRKKKISKKSKELEIKSVEPEIVITQEKDEVEEIVRFEFFGVFLKHNHKISSKYNSTFISLSPSYSQSFIYIVHTLQYNH